MVQRRVWRNEREVGDVVILQSQIIKEVILKSIVVLDKINKTNETKQ